MNHLKELTAEERAEMQQKAKETRLAKKEWAQKNLKIHCADDHLWRELATQYNYRLPGYYEKAAGKFVQRWLKHFGKTKEWYMDVTGYANGNEEARANPTMTARQQLGLLLEEIQWESR